MTDAKLAQLVNYCARGMRLLPCFEVTPSHACACHEGHGCRSRGKHPRVPDWDEVATTDPVQVERWHLRWPTANWAWALDRQFVLDDDPRNGGLEPDDFYERWEEFLGFQLTTTLTQRTGGGGVHLVYNQPTTAPVRNGKLRFANGRPIRGVEVKGVGGYVIVAPSNHLLGTYEWVDLTQSIEDPPAELLALYARRDGGRPADDRDTGNAGNGDPLGHFDHVDLDAWLAAGPDVPPGGQRPHLLSGVGAMRRRGYTRLTMITMAWSVASTFATGQPDWPWAERDVISLVDYALAHWESAVTPAQWEVARTLGTSPSSNGAAPSSNGDAPPAVTSSGVPGVPAPPDARPVATDRDVPATGGSAGNPHRVTDRANGIELARFLARRVLFVPEARVTWPWYIHDGRRWVADDERGAMLLVGEFIDRLRAVATASDGDLPDDEGTTLMSRASRLESAAGLGSALKFTAPLLARSILAFDQDPWLLNCPNGVLDLRAGELLPHGPHHLLTRLCPTPYVPDARDATWERVLHETFRGDEAKLRFVGRFIGYTLTGATSEKKFVVLTGPTNTGKSTLAEALYHTLGDVGDGGYATTWSADVVQADARVNRDEKLAKARGARMVLVGELDRGSRMADGFVKRYTGGDTMDARALYAPSYSYRPQAKLWMATNYVPRSSDPAVHDRMMPLPCVNVPSRLDREVKRHLDDDVDAHQAILAGAVERCRTWHRERTLGEVPWRGAFIEEFRRSSDHVADFIEERLDVGVDANWNAGTGVNEVHRTYQVWAEVNVGNRWLAKRTFNAAMRERGLVTGRGTGNLGELRWLGVTIRKLPD